MQISILEDESAESFLSLAELCRLRFAVLQHRLRLAFVSRMIWNQNKGSIPY